MNLSATDTARTIRAAPYPLDRTLLYTAMTGAQEQVVFVGEYAAGPVVGSDTVEGHTYDQHTELLLNTSTSDKQAVSHKFVWPFIAGAATSWSGSTGWQIDGIGFSEVFVSC